jgi:hypothetical protein
VARASCLGRGSWSCYAPDRYIPAPGIDRAAATTQNAGTLTASRALNTKPPGDSLPRSKFTGPERRGADSSKKENHPA